MTTVAFVINVGLFVKAKINLQNAVDAAAWSGASVQSRTLTDIAYLNWEMRNNYKEWLFKYYVLGNLSAQGVDNPAGSGVSNFRLRTFPGGPGDPYNIPSICIKPNSTVDVCSIYEVPGLPTLPETGFTSLDEMTETLQDSISKAKADSCAATSITNNGAAMTWAYGLGKNPIGDSNELSNLLVYDRPGAWTKGIELAFRIRNLEMQINEPPKSDLNIDNINNYSGVVQNERTIKAFYSAYRNLGNSAASELKDNFILTELAPTPINTQQNTLSALLIKGDTQKHYLDLNFAPINFVTFFTSLTPVEGRGQNINDSAKCNMIKMALPVPAFPFGFDKNQNVLTYYAVKGETKFNGLFNPFSDGITLTAYSAAKPFGGRIGPKIFDTSVEPLVVKPKGSVNAKSRKRSSAYLIGLKPNINNNSQNLPGLIPTSETFWVQDPNEVIGGKTTSATKSKFALPNMIYNKTSKPHYTSAVYTMPLPATSNGDYDIGLYDSAQLASLRSELSNSSTGISRNQIEEALKKVRSPNQYEARNYLIPSPNSDHGNLGLDFYGQATNFMQIYAPLKGSRNEGSQYESDDDLAQKVREFLESQEGAVKTYLEEMKDVRSTQIDQSSDKQANYEAAANSLYDLPNLSCNSMAGRFAYFILGNKGGVQDIQACSANYIDDLIKYFQTFNPDDGNAKNSLFYISKDGYPLDSKRELSTEKFSAYFPGVLTGGSNDASGQLIYPFRPQDQTRSLRNSYSTKFISLHSIQGEVFNCKYHEGRSCNTDQDTSGLQVINALQGNLEDLKIYQ